MTTSTHLIRTRRFLPLFVTQLLGAFNDNLFKNSVVLFVVYNIYNSQAAEARFSAISSGVFIIPFFLFSSLSGQLADMRDKAKIIRVIKACEIGIMLVGAAGLLLAWRHIAVDALALPLMLLALFAMGTHSTFFGPIKYAILPQHLQENEVLAGTGLVEAGTYMAILAGTMLAGVVVDYAQWVAAGVVITALVGYVAGREVPSAPPHMAAEPLDFHIIRASITLIRTTMEDARVFLAILAISFFWAIGAILFIEFPPLAKNVLAAKPLVASLFLAIFSVGVAIGSMSINMLLKGKVSARYSPASVLVMAVFVVALEQVCQLWVPNHSGHLMNVAEFFSYPLSFALMATLLGIAIAGGMFVVPLYAFLTTCVDKSLTARTIAANNVVNSLAMVLGAVLAISLSAFGVKIVQQLLLSAVMCLISAWLAFLLYRAEQRVREDS